MRLTSLVATVLLASGAWAQVVVWPESLRVTVPQGQQSVEALVLSTSAGDDVSYCLNFDIPLQRSPSESFGAGCGAVGGLIAFVDQPGIGFNWNPYAITMTPAGRLFAAEFGGIRTYEMTADLQYVTRFFSPLVTELAPNPVTVGITFNQDTVVDQRGGPGVRRASNTAFGRHAGGGDDGPAHRDPGAADRTAAC